MLTSAATVCRDAVGLSVSWANGVSVTFALDRERVLGIRAVSVHGVPLRNPSRLWRPLITTPEGIHYATFLLKEVRESDDGGVQVVTEAVGIFTGIQEEVDEYLIDMLTLSSSDGPVSDTLIWELSPSALTLDGYDFTGLAFRYHFLSSDPQRRIYRIFDDATWEIDEHVQGNTLLLQGQVNPPVTALQVEDYFTTACNYYGAEMCGVQGTPKRVSMQRLPRIGTLQPFDFLTHARGVLFNYFDPLLEVLSIVHKDCGEDMLHVLDELRQPCAAEFRSHPKHILFHPLAEALPRAAQRNLWLRALEFVHTRERERAGITKSVVLPRVWIPQVGGETAILHGREIARADFLDYLADAVLPRWAEMGVREICTHSLWVSDYTVDRKVCKDDSGLQGGLTVGSICCARVHEIDPLWGGVDAVARFTERAHALGMQVQLWWATHLSRRAPIFAERPDFMMMARDGLANGGGFGHQTLVTLNLMNPECLEWEFDKLRAVREATGIDGFFHDSYGNMTFLPVNYADPRRVGQQRAYEQLVARLQGIGLRSFTIEGMGPYGVGHFGMNLFPKNKALPKGNYQNLLDWWLGQEDMIYGLSMGIGQWMWPEEERAREFAFRCLAYGGRFGFTQHEEYLEMWSGWLRAQNQLHARIAPIVGKRTLLPDDQGVLWEREHDQLLFTFRAFTYSLPADVTVTREDSNDHVDMPVPQRANGIMTGPWEVYRIQ